MDHRRGERFVHRPAGQDLPHPGHRSGPRSGAGAPCGSAPSEQELVQGADPAPCRAGLLPAGPRPESGSTKPNSDAATAMKLRGVVTLPSMPRRDRESAASDRRHEAIAQPVVTPRRSSGSDRRPAAYSSPLDGFRSSRTMAEVQVPGTYIPARLDGVRARFACSARTRNFSRGQALS